MALSHELAALAAEEFVLLTTFRRNGEPVPTPVWIAVDHGRLVVSTPEDTGKLKRLRHTREVTLQPCSRRGKPRPGSATVSAVAEVSREPLTRVQAEAALRAKYRWQWRLIIGIEALVRRGQSTPRPVVIVMASPAPDNPGEAHASPDR